MTLRCQQPGLRALGIVQAGVQAHQTTGKAGGKPPHQLWRQGNFRHQDQGLLTARARSLDRLKVDLRLATPGHPVEQEGSLLTECINDSLESCGLLANQRRTGVLRRVQRQRSAEAHAHRTALDQRRKRCSPSRADGRQDCRIHTLACGQTLDQTALHRCASQCGQQCIERLLKGEDLALLNRSRRTLPENTRQGRYQHLTNGVVVIARSPDQQRQHIGGEHRRAVDHLPYRFDAPWRKRRFNRDRHHEPNQLPPRERHHHTQAGHRWRGISRPSVVKQSGNRGRHGHLNKNGCLFGRRARR